MRIRFFSQLIFLITLMVAANGWSAVPYFTKALRSEKAYSGFSVAPVIENGLEHYVVASTFAGDSWLSSYGADGERRWAQRIKSGGNAASFVFDRGANATGSRFVVFGNTGAGEGQFRIWVQHAGRQGLPVQHALNGDVGEQPNVSDAGYQSMEIHAAYRVNDRIHLAGAVYRDSHKKYAWLAEASDTGEILWHRSVGLSAERWSGRAAAFMRTGGGGAVVLFDAYQRQEDSNEASGPSRAYVVTVGGADGTGTVRRELNLQPNFTYATLEAGVRVGDHLVGAVRWREAAGVPGGYRWYTDFVRINSAGEVVARRSVPDSHNGPRFYQANVTSNGSIVFVGQRDNTAAAYRIDASTLAVRRAQTFGNYYAGILRGAAECANASRDLILVGGAISGTIRDTKLVLKTTSDLLQPEE